MASSRFMLSAAKKPFDEYTFGPEMMELANKYLNQYDADSDELLSLKR